VASATAASASISVVLKGAKNFWVANSLGAWLRRQTLTSLKSGRSRWYCVVYAAGLLWSHPPGWQRTWLSQTCLLHCSPSAGPVTPVGRLCICHTVH
jgi:hypothetical protein